MPSDDAVLDTVLRSGGVDPSSVHRVTIGFNAVADLAAGKVDAATGFWNAEGVELQQRGIPIREFRVDDFGAPRYPELVVATTPTNLRRGSLSAGGPPRGYGFLGERPDQALDDLLEPGQRPGPGIPAGAVRGAYLGGRVRGACGQRPPPSTPSMNERG